MALNQTRKPEQEPSAGKIIRTPAPDAISAPRSGAGQGYGTNGPVGNSPSVEPAKSVMSPLAQNLKESSDDGENVLEQVIAHGVSGRDDRVPADGNKQTRTVSADAYPTTFGHRSRNADSKAAQVPSKIGAGPDVEANPIRKPQ